MFFQNVNEGQPDPVFGLVEAFGADVRPTKVNLIVGIYKDENLKTQLLPSVQKAGEQLGYDQGTDYLPIDGDREFIELLGPVVFGKGWKEAHGRIYAAQTVGGTGALRAGVEFLAQEVTKKVAVSNHTWPNHRSIIERGGAMAEEYVYYSREKRGFDLQAMLHSLDKLPEKSAVLLHACCHNPTGCDPTADEWREISAFFKKKKLLPFFDCAYQGFGVGIDEDVESIRIFLEEGHEMLIAYSCSKNFSMYCQRVGALFVVDANAAVKMRVGSQVKRIIRGMVSNPPASGERLVKQVLKKDDLRSLWHQDLEHVRTRLNSVRNLLADKLSKSGDFQYLKNHRGMFSFIDLNKSQVQKLIDRFGIYLLDNGRVSVAGLTMKNIDYVVEGIVAVLE
jgi:aspartate/tyrosine/aromatic aminotransferase